MENLSTNVRSKQFTISEKLEFGKKRPEHLGKVATNIFLLPHRTFPSRKEKDILSLGEMSQFQRNGKNITYWHWKNPGKQVLLIHGWNGHSGNLSRFVQPLLDLGLSVVSLDLPGHGSSEGKFCNIVLSAETIVDLVKIVGSPSLIISHSFGGAVATVAQELGVSVEKAVYISPPSRLELLREVFSKSLGLDDSVKEEMRMRMERKIHRSLDSLDLERSGKVLDSELLVIHDESDNEVPFIMGKRVARAWKKGSFFPTKGLGHQMILRSEDVIEKAVQFIAKETIEEKNLLRLNLV
ncbi:alpha/beta hydrolase [Leptospira idonii]|uniref:Alpha/beta hydrolase n=1 Tax=Leptospira idonii TaxID=1193500 RepID=A0A4R9M3N8_9LEPT|nr:alpha/beta hydrolase [Leptospira idonii]TGN19889.1 alpha/beta hydrolase [Leptospira idonii]